LQERTHFVEASLQIAARDARAEVAREGRLLTLAEATIAPSFDERRHGAGVSVGAPDARK
jgi:hypothetical protein